VGSAGPERTSINGPERRCQGFHGHFTMIRTGKQSMKKNDGQKTPVDLAIMETDCLEKDIEKAGFFS
jgi:hypothetical protein